MNMFQAVASVFKNYANFQGRARRKEYWLFFLFNFLLVAVLNGAVSAIALSADDFESVEVLVFGLIGLISLYSLAILIPSLAVCCRRLHDIGRSGAYILFAFIPVVGGIFLLIWLLQGGTPGDNQYGPDPKAAGNRSWNPPSNDLFPEWNEPNVHAAPPPPVKQMAGNVPDTVVVRYEEPQMDRGVSPGYADPNDSGYRIVGNAGVLAGRRLQVPAADALIFGRNAQNCNVVFPSGTPGVSGVHCKLRVQNGAVYLTDMGSSNGTYLSNGQRLTPNQAVQIYPGESISFGSVQQQVRLVKK